MYSTAYDMFLWTRFLLGLADVPLLEPSTLAVGYPGAERSYSRIVPKCPILT